MLGRVSDRLRRAYKRTTIERRLARRVAKLRHGSLEQYSAYLAAHPDEASTVYEGLLIHVTELFRDRPVIDRLVARVFPEILAKQPKDAPVRVWVPGCSTGEELYTFAILLLESVGEHGHQIQLITHSKNAAICCSGARRPRRGLVDELLGQREDVAGAIAKSRKIGLSHSRHDRPDDTVRPVDADRAETGSSSNSPNGGPRHGERGSTLKTEEFEILDRSDRHYRIVDGSIKDHPVVGAKAMNIQTGRVHEERIPFFPLVASEWRSSTPSSHLRAKTMCERRRGGRVDSRGTVVLHGEVPIRARIIDLAIGGVRVRIDPTVARPSIGTQVRIDLRLDGPGSWTRLLGRILRGARTGSEDLAIELHDVPATFEDLVQDELLASVECARTPQVLVVDADPTRRELVAEAFQEIGFHAMEASSALEAIAGVDESRLHLWAVVIADTDLDPRADDLRAFLAAAYPSVPQIVVGVRGRRRCSTCLSVDQIPDLALQVHRLVTWEDPIGYQ